MKANIPEDQAGERGGVFCSDGEYLSEEMVNLDVLARRQLMRMQNRNSISRFDRYQGLLLEEAEIHDLLNSKVCAETRGQTEQINAIFRRQEERLVSRRKRTLAAGTSLRFSTLAQEFGLSRRQELIMLLALAPDIDRKYEKCFAFLQDDLTRKRPTVDLITSMLTDTLDERWSCRSEFVSGSLLVKEKLISLEDAQVPVSGSLLGRTVKLEETVVEFLCGRKREQIMCRDRVWKSLETAASALKAPASPLRQQGEGWLGWFRNRQPADGPCPIIHLQGPPGVGKRMLTEWIASCIGRGLLVLDAAALLGCNNDQVDTLSRLTRDLRLLRPAVRIEQWQEWLEENRSRESLWTDFLFAVCRATTPVFLCGSREWRPRHRELLYPPIVRWEIELPDEDERQVLWRGMLNGQLSREAAPGLSALSATFPLSRPQIEAVIRQLECDQACRQPHRTLTLEDLYGSCRRYCQNGLHSLARRIEPRYKWQDLVVEEETMAQLREIGAHVRHRQLVFRQWGWNKKVHHCRGVTALFHGPSGTGKSMAAEIIAGDLGLEVLKVELSAVVSKYIGETEKNLEAIFNEAQASNALLHFEEADALFGKRSEVKDSHDRYANIEIGYLLQKMDEYEGIAVLTTNLRRNMDEAFVRRLRFIIEFPFPDEHQRLLLWQCHIPAEAPVQPQLDLEFLARQFSLSGGNIRNITLNAAFLAAVDQPPLGMIHLIRSVCSEYLKMGRHCSSSELGPYGGLAATGAVAQGGI